MSPVETEPSKTAINAIEASKLSRRYGRRWALANVTFQLARGRTLMVAGANGSGKSTLLRLLGGALRPDHGSAVVDGFDLVRERQQVRQRSALLSHHPNTYEALTARENLNVSAKLLGAASHDIPSLLERVGLADRGDDAVATFSAGMRKRLALARVLLQTERSGNGVSIVLLDEPYGELDPSGFDLVDSLLSGYRQRGITVVMTTHLIEHGARMSDEALLLDQGQVRWVGPATELSASRADVMGGA